jgi:hypothetical protein
MVDNESRSDRFGTTGTPNMTEQNTLTTEQKAKVWIRDYWYNLGDYLSEPLPEHKRVELEQFVKGLIEDRNARAREVVEQTITKFTPWIEHHIECIRSFDKYAECDCGLTKALTKTHNIDLSTPKK